jgi:hypothetical protein
MRDQGRNVGIDLLAQSNDWVKPLMRPDWGHPARYGWWAPVASAIKKRSGARDAAPKVHCRHIPPPQPYRSRAALGRQEAPPSPPRRSPQPLPSSSAGGGPKAAGTCAVHRNRRIRSTPTRISSAPSPPWRTRHRAPQRLLHLWMICTLCASSSPSSLILY